MAYISVMETPKERQKRLEELLVGKRIAEIEAGACNEMLIRLETDISVFDRDDVESEWIRIEAGWIAGNIGLFGIFCHKVEEEQK